MILFNNYISIILDDEFKPEKHEKVIKQISQILKLNKNISNIHIDDMGDVQFKHNDELFAISYYHDECTIRLFESKRQNGWNERSDDFEIIIAFFDLTIPDELLEKFIYELT